MPSDKPKYSGLLEENQVEILNQFCQLHGVSKSQAIGIFLDQWNESGQPELTINGMAFDDHQVTYLVTDLVHNLLDDPAIINRLANNQDFIEKVSNKLVTKLASIKELKQEITSDVIKEVRSIDMGLNNSISQSSMVGIERVIANGEPFTAEVRFVETETAELEDEPITIEETETVNDNIELQNKKDDNLVSNQKANSKKADTTSEQSVDDKTTYGGYKGNDISKEKTFDDTITTITTLHSEGKTNGEIVKVLNNDGYPTKKGIKGKWRSYQVQSILKKT